MQTIIETFSYLVYIYSPYKKIAQSKTVIKLESQAVAEYFTLLIPLWHVFIALSKANCF